MFKNLLEFIVKESIYTEIKGVSPAGSQKGLVKFPDMGDVYVQGKAIFSVEMVSTILFHNKGCTIVLKS